MSAEVMPAPLLIGERSNMALDSLLNSVGRAHLHAPEHHPEAIHDAG